MTYIGDFLASGSADYIFTTIDAGGTPSALSGGSVVVYKNNGTVESSSGVTLTASFDGRTGMNHVGINLAADGSFYAAGSNFNVALAVGTVSSVSIAGYRLCSFSVENRNQKPTGGTVANVSGSVTGGVLSAGTITNPILVQGGTIALATAAGTINNPVLVYGGTVGLATAAGTINNPVLVYGGTVALATAAGTVNSPVRVYGGTVDVATTLTNAPSDSAGVTTLLSRIPAALFSGITSLAQWLGLLAGFQVGNSTARTELRATGAGSGTFDETLHSQQALYGGSLIHQSKVLKYFQVALRKDVGISSDNATEITEINANGGSGAGAYSNTSDSQEAIRDRGDASWVTAGTVTVLSNSALVAIGTAIFDLSNAIETGETLRQELRLFRAVLFGESNASDVSAGNIVFYRKDGVTAAGTAVYNAEGDRTDTNIGNLS